jgi:Dolichyl-phosphate-mannose-protein mannosyltransferase
MTLSTKQSEFFFVSLIILFAVLIRIPSLTQPLGPDQGVLAVIGKGILNGELPYKDYWEMGSPAIFFTYALIFKTFGVSMAAIPITDIVVSMLTTFFIFLLSKRIWNVRVGYISALLFAFFANGVRLGMHAGGDIAFGTFWYIAQRETFMLPLIVFSIYLLVASKKEYIVSWRLILSGFMAGLTFVYKFPGILFFICLILYMNVGLFVPKGQKPLTSFLKKNFFLISGFVLSLIPFAIFFSTKGVLSEMIDIIFKYVFSVYGQLNHNYLGIIKTGLARTYFIAMENFILWMFLITSPVYIIVNDRTKENLLIVAWAIASVLYVISHREFFGYHYLIILPPFSILAGYGIAKAIGPKLKLKEMFTADFGKCFIAFALLVNLCFFASLNYMHYTKFYYYITGQIDKVAYYSFFTAYPKHDYSFPADYEVAQYLKIHTKPNDFIYALGGIESVIYFLTKRKSPSRFIFSWIIFSHTHGKVKQAEYYRQELLANLKTRTPKYIITIGPLATFESFNDIYCFINNTYVFDKKFPDDRFVYVNKNHRDGQI